MGISPVAGSRRRRLRPYLAVTAAVALAAGAAAVATAASASTGAAKVTFAGYHTPTVVSKALYDDRTTTPIKHLVVIFDENVSFDHYFGTYPYAANTDGTPFYAKPGTQKVNGLYTKITPSGPVGPLLTVKGNPNEYPPQRLTSSESLTSDQNHGYLAEEDAEDNGKMDMFVQDTEGSTAANGTCGVEYCPPGIVMDYFDGNTVTGLWNYAQYYSMSDNNWDTSFGPSTPGAINVTSGNTSGAEALSPAWSSTPGAPTTSADIASVNSSTGLGTLFSDEDPYYDDCSDGNHASNGALAALTGENIGDLLNNSKVSWGWFEGGFAPTGTSAAPAGDPSATLPVCGSAHANIGGASTNDYVPHHNPFEYYASTANPAHLAPSSLAQIGYTDQANHQYDMSYFSDALDGAGGATLPSVSYLKAPAYEDGHPGYSDPTDEQTFLVNTINSIEKSKYWPSTAIVITYDDSDGWYDHQAPTIINGSSDANTSSTNSAQVDTAMCAEVAVTVGTANGRCGFSQRLPMVVISPYTRENYVSSNLTDTTSVVKFIEDNWLHGERIPGSFDAVSGSLDAPGGLLDFYTFPHFQPVILNPTTGAVVSGGGPQGNNGAQKGEKATS
jgi:phospholipase C